MHGSPTLIYIFLILLSFPVCSLAAPDDRSAFGDPLSGTGLVQENRSYVVLVTSTTGGSIHPDGAITVPAGSDLDLNCTPSPGSVLAQVMIDGRDEGPSQIVHLSSISGDRTVHGVFVPDGNGGPGPSSIAPAMAIPVSIPHDTPSISAASQIPAPLIRSEGALIAQSSTLRTITVGPSGSDYLHISDAVANASSGDTILIMNGTYHEMVTIDKPLSLIGEEGGSARPVIIPDRNRTAVNVTADHVLLKNLTVSGDPDHFRLSDGVSAYQISNLSVDQCVLTGFDTGLSLNQVTDVSITNSTLKENRQGVDMAGIRNSTIAGSYVGANNIGVIGAQVAGLSFVGNHISKNEMNGVAFLDGISNSRLSENLITGNNYLFPDNSTGWMNTGIYLEYASDVSLIGNSLTDNGGCALRLDGGILITLSNNTLTNNYAGFLMTGVVVDPGNRIDTSNTIDGLPLLYYEGVSDQSIERVTPATLYLQDCTNMTVRDLSMDSRNGYGIVAKGVRGLTIANCSVSQNLNQNLLLANVSDVSVTGCEISTGKLYGIGIFEAERVTVTGNSVHGNLIGLSLRGETRQVNITANSFIQNQEGIVLQEVYGDSLSAEINENSIRDGHIGLKGQDSRNISLHNTLFLNLSSGIILEGCSGMAMEKNAVEASMYGIVLLPYQEIEGSDSETICSVNTITRSSIIAGIDPITLAADGVYENTINLNNFIRKTASQTVEPTSPEITSTAWGGMNLDAAYAQRPDTRISEASNLWNTPDKVKYWYGNETFSGYLGNHWGDYNGTEIGKSGVGEPAWQINPVNNDTYPLIGTEDRYIVLNGRYPLALLPGWNFVSTPGVLAPGNNTASIFAEVDTAGHSMYAFNNSTWVPVRAGDPILPLHGYWIYAAGTIGVPLIFDPATIPLPAHLTVGWNAIGHPALQPAPAQDVLSSLDSAWSYVIRYNALRQQYEDPIIRGSNDTELMTPSQGYWIYMTQEWDLQPVTG
ncbi:MAG TPA: right-handed parallel beta-helix repeat-containing protein [Methanospirillum sp.]|nr:right-handed parallel beta-helix repeat-containing protein [Methanospirillum sp.]